MDYSRAYLIKLLRRMSRKDGERAFAEFFEVYYDKFLHVAQLYVSDRSQAEEIVSDTFVKLVRNRSRLNKVSNPKGYLYLCVKNQALTYIKKENRTCQGPSIHQMEDYLFATAATPETDMMHKELEEVISDTINRLPPKRQTVYKLIKEEKLQYKEVSKLLDISVKTVEVHMGLAVKTLRDAIESYQCLQEKDKPSYKVAN